MLQRSTPSLVVLEEPSQLTSSHHPSLARYLVGALRGVWVLGTLLDLWVETKLVPKLCYLT